MQLDHLKIIFAVIIFILTLVGNILPLFITTIRWTSRLESLAGGVFLGAGLAHLLAEANEEFEEVDGLAYPLAPALALAFLVLLSVVELFTYSEHDADAFGDHGHDHGGGHDHYNPIGNASLMTSDNDNDIAKQDNKQSSKMVEFGNTNKFLTAATISLYIIMDIHSAIEGIALGILPKLSNAIAIFCAIIGHKPVEAFALSLIIIKCRPTKIVFWIMVIIYAVLSPAAIIVAMYIGSKSNSLALGIIESLSAGTFLFVGSHEWSEMFHHKHEWKTSEKLWHLGMFTFGVLWMLLIAIIEAETGGHHHH
ncbi:ZIP Zinc transporter family protein [Histomonas meleagridis]|uniref:ZIP Zinc transporter family protein n=1 Tax=Histomonas meleagridis TaxID=135588 RepID=UPI00355967E0|nr:ZIP Zinc transporter family protein [Histomonas meleagridis]KAH0804281.1 ZIP Zinc transporter family protein [Histomonas meleagridis]